jgi:hypothetical protein
LLVIRRGGVMAGGRPPKGPKIVDRFEASKEAKDRLKIILETITGETSVLEARERLGVSDTRFYQLRDEVLKAGLSRMEPAPRGRPRKAPPESAAEVARLREENEALKQALEKERVRTVLSEALPHVVKTEDEKKKRRRPPGRRGGEGEKRSVAGGRGNRGRDGDGEGRRDP